MSFIVTLPKVFPDTARYGSNKDSFEPSELDEKIIPAPGKIKACEEKSLPDHSRGSFTSTRSIELVDPEEKNNDVSGSIPGIRRVYSCNLVDHPFDSLTSKRKDTLPAESHSYLLKRCSRFYNGLGVDNQTSSDSLLDLKEKDELYFRAASACDVYAGEEDWGISFARRCQSAGGEPYNCFPIIPDKDDIFPTHSKKMKAEIFEPKDSEEITGLKSSKDSSITKDSSEEKQFFKKKPVLSQSLMNGHLCITSPPTHRELEKSSKPQKRKKLEIIGEKIKLKSLFSRAYLRRRESDGFSIEISKFKKDS